jgi:2-polyprenyl-3-methyl-5-hydroxy-6-metoxy-1,4-benzoquinol methylase
MQTPQNNPGTGSEISRRCPVCGQDATTAYIDKNALHLVRCTECSMIYANPAPADFASGQFYTLAGAEYYLDRSKLESDYAPVRFQRELRFFRKYCETGSVLDVGCSTGAFLYQLHKQNPGAYKILGMDASGPALDYAESKGVPVVRGDFLSHDFGEVRFNAITFWAVLEHLLEPKAFLRKAAQLLKPDGVCLVLVPNMRSLAARILNQRYRYIYPQHLNYFTRTTLELLVRDEFSVLEHRSMHFNPVIIWQDFRSGGREVSNRERAELLKRTTGYKQNPMLKPLRFGYRGMDGILAKLNLADNLAFALRKSEHAVS